MTTKTVWDSFQYGHVFANSTIEYGIFGEGSQNTTVIDI